MHTWRICWIMTYAKYIYRDEKVLRISIWTQCLKGRQKVECCQRCKDLVRNRNGGLSNSHPSVIQLSAHLFIFRSQSCLLSILHLLEVHFFIQLLQFLKSIQSSHYTWANRRSKAYFIWKVFCQVWTRLLICHFITRRSSEKEKHPTWQFGTLLRLDGRLWSEAIAVFQVWWALPEMLHKCSHLILAILGGIKYPTRATKKNILILLH